MSECIDNCSLIVFKDAEIGKLKAENTALKQTIDELRYNWMEETRQLNQQLETTKEQLTKYEGYKKLDEFLSKNVNTDKESFIQKCFELEEQLVEAKEYFLKIAGHCDSCPLDRNRNKCNDCKEFPQDNHSYCIFFTATKALQALKKGGKENE